MFSLYVLLYLPVLYQVPGAEGRAGMAAIVDPDGKLDLETLAQGLKSSLPVYARPLFVRVCSDIPATGTFSFALFC